MYIYNKLYFILKLSVIAAFFLPMVTTHAVGGLKLINANPPGGDSIISFYDNKIGEFGYPGILDKVCVNDIFVDLKSYTFTIYQTLPQIENVYSGSLISPKPGDYRFKYTETDNCNTSKSKEILLIVKKYHQYELNLIENSSKGLDLNLKADNYRGDVSITTIDQNIVRDGYTRVEVGSCMDNVLVSTLSDSSKMAFLTTTDEPGFPRVTVGEHVVSTYDGEKCTDISTTVDIKPNTWYVFEVPLDGSQQSVAQSSTAIKQEYIVESPDVGRGASTVRTGGYSLHSYNFLILLLIILLQVIIPNQLKG
jgi:hypothetical protein